MSLSAQTPGHNDWYWESLVNLHIAGNSVGKGKTVQELTEIMRDLPISMFQVSALRNDGVRVHYPSQILPNAGGDWDTPAVWKQVAANLDRKFCIYMNSLGLLQDKQHPEWMRRKSDGSGISQGSGSRMCVKPAPGKDGWLETILLPVVKEVVTKYKPDGIWMDGDWNVNADVCWCDNCKKAWQLKTGKSEVPTSQNDPNWPAWLRFHFDRCDEFRKMVADAIHEIHPDCMYTSNGGWRIMSARRSNTNAGAWNDARSAPEWVGTMTHDLSHSDALTRTRYQSMALSPEEKTPGDNMHLIVHNTISMPRILQEAGLTMAGGSAWFMWSFYYQHEDLNTGARFVRDRSSALGRSYSQNPIAVLASETSWERRNMDGKTDYYNSDYLLNAALALQDARFGVDIINEHILNSRVRNYCVLVIADNQREVMPRTVESLKAYVKEGGMLLIMGSGLLDSPGKEVDIENLLGLKRTGIAEGSNSLNMGGKITSFSSSWDVETSGAEVLAVYDSGKPFLTRNKVGKGTVGYVSAAGPISYPDNDGVFSQIMDKLSVNPWVQVQSGDQGKHLVYSFRSKPGRLYLHMVNLTSHMNGQRIEPNSSNAIDTVAVIARLELNLELPAQPQEINVVPATSGVEHTWNDGILNLTLTNIDYHAAVEIIGDGIVSEPLPDKQIQLECIDSSSGNPVGGLNVIFWGESYTTDNLGLTPMFETPAGNYQIGLQSTTWQLLGNNTLEVYTDSVFRLYVKELPKYSVQMKFMDSLTETPLVELELLLMDSTYITNTQGMILIPELYEGSHTLSLPDHRFYIAGNPVIEVRSDTMISILVTRVFQLNLQVINRATGAPVNRAPVEVNDAPYYSNSFGYIEVGKFPSGSFQVLVSHKDYFPFSDTLLFLGDTTMVLSLTPKIASVTFQVSDLTGPVSSAQVLMTFSQYTNFSGQALFLNQPARMSYNFTVSKTLYNTLQDSFYLETDTTLMVLLDKVVSINDKDFPGLLIKPNPFDSYIHITLQEKAQLNLYDISGIMRLTMKLEEGVNTIPSAYLEKGFYMMKISGKERVFNKMIVK